MPYGTEPTLDDVWARFKWDVVNIFSNDPNPYALAGEGDFKGAKRTAVEDITHAAKNVVVHAYRAVKKSASGVKDKLKRAKDKLLGDDE